MGSNKRTKPSTATNLGRKCPQGGSNTAKSKSMAGLKEESLLESLSISELDEQNKHLPLKGGQGCRPLAPRRHPRYPNSSLAAARSSQMNSVMMMKKRRRALRVSGGRAKSRAVRLQSFIVNWPYNKVDKVNTMRLLFMGLILSVSVLSLIVMAQNYNSIRKDLYNSKKHYEDDIDDLEQYNSLSSADLKKEDLNDIHTVRKKLQTQQRLSMKANFRRTPQGFLNRPKRPIFSTPFYSELKSDTPIPVDSSYGIDFASVRRSERLTTIGSKQRASAEENMKYRCHTSKYDRIISQMSANNISRPLIQPDGHFENPFATWRPLSYVDVLRFMLFEADESKIPRDKEELDRELPIRVPYFVPESRSKGRMRNKLNASNEAPDFRVTWIGHSTLLIQVDGLNILTDPIFSERASPSQMFGPQRFREPACDIDSLPRIDVVLISHDHYDHLDADSVRDINARFGIQCRWVVPMGLGEFMRSMGVENYVELDWWQKDCYHVGNAFHPPPRLSEKLASLNVSNDSAAARQRGQRIELDIYFTPTQHWSRRSVTDVNRSLWGGYVIVNGNGSTFFFGGDTGYCSAFKEIGRLFGPFTGAAIPIGAYKPTWFMSPSHVDPQEAIQIHRDIRSLSSLSIHHGTFPLANEFYLEPKRLLKRLMDYKSQAIKHPFVSIDHGDTLDFNRPQQAAH